MNENEQPRVHIRWMIRRDMAEVLQIEANNFINGWEEMDFLKALRNRQVVGMVAEQDEKVIGFMLYELHKSRLNIINFAVRTYHHRQGIGSKMVSKLVSKLSSHRRKRITLEVREGNLTAQLFFKACGFRAESITRGYYEDTDEDAYMMVYRMRCTEPIDQEEETAA